MLHHRDGLHAKQVKEVEREGMLAIASDPKERQQLMRKFSAEREQARKQIMELSRLTSKPDAV